MRTQHTYTNGRGKKLGRDLETRGKDGEEKVGKDEENEREGWEVGTHSFGELFYTWPSLTLIRP
jgi:hypothetical protein